MKALREAHRMVGHPMVASQPLQPVERAHMRELVPIVASAGVDRRA